MLNIDVGAGNTWMFLIFLFNTAFVCAYCAYLSSQVIMGEMEKENMFTGKFKTKSGEEKYLPWTFLVQVRESRATMRENLTDLVCSGYLHSSRCIDVLYWGTLSEQL